MTYPVITAAIKADTNRIIPDLSFENVVPVLSEEPLKPGKGSSKDVREQGLFLLGSFGVDITQPLHVIIVGILVIGRSIARPQL